MKANICLQGTSRSYRSFQPLRQAFESNKGNIMETVSVMPGALELLIMLVPLVTCSVITGLCIVFPFWRIFGKAGFSGALALLMFIPVVNIGMVFFLAFSRWPSLESLESKQQG